jgi:glycosyltransferase involved in cell wall biosynthesis
MAFEEPYEVRTVFPDDDVNAVPSSVVSRAVSKQLRSIKPAAVAIPGWSHKAALAALQWCLQADVPAVVMSDSNLFDVPRHWWREGIKKRLVQLYSAGFAAGTAQARYLEYLGLRPDQISIGYDAVDNEYFGTGAAQSRRESASLRFKLRLPERYFLASARFVPHKNILGLIRAYAAYRERCAGAAWHLVVLGDGAQRAEILAMVDRLNLRGLVLTPGFKQYDELPAYYGLADAFVHASLTEQWGLVVNEAMACRLPVLVSNRCGCVPDLVREGVNGATFDPTNLIQLAELMLRYSSTPEALREMGQASALIVERFSLSRFSDGLWAATERALQNRARKGTLDRILVELLMRR